MGVPIFNQFYLFLTIERRYLRFTAYAGRPEQPDRRAHNSELRTITFFRIYIRTFFVPFFSTIRIFGFFFYLIRNSTLTGSPAALQIVVRITE